MYTDQVSELKASLSGRHAAQLTPPKSLQFTDDFALMQWVLVAGPAPRRGIGRCSPPCYHPPPRAGAAEPCHGHHHDCHRLRRRRWRSCCCSPRPAAVGARLVAAAAPRAAPPRAGRHAPVPLTRAGGGGDGSWKCAVGGKGDESWCLVWVGGKACLCLGNRAMAGCGDAAAHLPFCAHLERGQVALDAVLERVEAQVAVEPVPQTGRERRRPLPVTL